MCSLYSFPSQLQIFVNMCAFFGGIKSNAMIECNGHLGRIEEEKNTRQNAAEYLFSSRTGQNIYSAAERGRKRNAAERSRTGQNIYSAAKRSRA